MPCLLTGVITCSPRQSDPSYARLLPTGKQAEPNPNENGTGRKACGQKDS